MKKIIPQLLLLIPLLLIATAVSAYVAPTGAPTVNNTDMPINDTATGQIKSGGLSVGVFQTGNSGGAALLDQVSIFHGALNGGMPGATTSSLNFGTVAKKVDAAITGTLALMGNLQSDSLKTSTGQRQVCADSTGKFFLCGTGNTSTNNTTNEKYIYSTALGNTAAQGNLGNGDCTPGYTTIALETGNVVVNDFGSSFANNHISVRDPWPNPLSVTGSNDPDTFASRDNAQFDSTLSHSVDVSQSPQTLAFTAPDTGTYDIKYRNNGHISMNVENGKYTVDRSTLSAVSFYMVVKKVNGAQEAYPLIPISNICTAHVVGGGIWASLLVSGGPSDSDNTAYYCGPGTDSNDTYHAEREYLIDASQTLSLQKGDRVYMLGLSVGVASKTGPNGGSTTSNFGVDKCKSFNFKVANGLTIFDVTYRP